MKTKKIVKSNTDNWSLALLAYQQGQFPSAVKFCQKMTSKHPSFSDANNLLGAIALGSKDYATAFDSFNKAVTSNEKNASYHNNLGIALRGLQRLEEARQSYEKAIELQENYPDAYFNLGNVLRDLGEDDKAVEAFCHATTLKSDYHGAWNNLGNTLRALKRPNEAADAYRTALSIRDDEQTRSNLAFALRESGNNATSLDLQRETVAAQPDNAALHFNLANALRDSDLIDEAMSHYRYALALEPNYAAAANNLGSIWMKKGEALAALECYQRAVFFDPTNSDYFANVGNAESGLATQGNTSTAFKHYPRAVKAIRKAIELKPDCEAYYYNLANYLRVWLLRDSQAQITLDEIEAIYKRAIEIKPDFADAWNNLGGLYSDHGRDESAIEAYQQALKFDSKNWQYHFNLAQRLHTSGDIEACRLFFKSGLDIKEHAGARIRYETLFPAVMESEEAIIQTRENFALGLNRLQENKITIKDPMSDIAVAPMFYLAYHGECNADLMRSYTNLIRTACPSIDYVAPHCSEPSLHSGKIRIGFISKFLHSHTIGRFFRGILKNLNREHFEIFTFMCLAKQDDITKWISTHSDHFEILPSTLPEAREHISAHKLDILVYADIGMEPFSYYLAFSRLARVQCVLYGHPDTTGIPTIDYYLSSGACESAEADSHYTEKLIRLDPNSTYTYYYRPLNRAIQKTRADLNLPQGKHLYTCAQSMFKIHPEMDAVFDDILEGDLNGVLLLFDDISLRRINLFKTRLQKRMRHYDRVIFLPRMQLPDFLQILHLSDALLDSFHFCGGNTSFDSFAAESPVVTLPGEFMRGRQTMGLYKRMGFMDLVAEDKADYVSKALHLGKDKQFRQMMRQELANRAPAIYEDAGVVRALEEFFLSAVN
jgi:predicted O-linked N-acetylglucosamine transferase (SPINDLY family)